MVLRVSCGVLRVFFIGGLALGAALPFTAMAQSAGGTGRPREIASIPKSPPAIHATSMDDPRGLAARVLFSGPVGAPASQPVINHAALVAEDLPDPVDVPQVYAKRFEALGQKLRIDYRRKDPVTGLWRGIYPTAERYVAEIARPNRVRLTLADAIRRALSNNYQIRVEGYGPAISQAQVVQADAAFDGAFFVNFSRDDRDQPVAAQIQAGESENYLYQAGLRQRMPTGGLIQISQGLGWSDFPGFAFQILNPAYSTNFILEFQQPLLRNFGIDFNRSQIDISKNNGLIARETFRRQVITTLNDTERAYWQLVGARRQLVVAAEWLAQSVRTLEQVEARSDYDAFRTLVSNSQATVETRKSEFIRFRNAVYDAEDALRNLMNDSELNMAAALEIVPVDLPALAPVVRDIAREVESALEHRPEIKEARLAVENARIQIGIAKNQALPSLDLVWRHTLNGLGGSTDEAFDVMTGRNFIDNFLSLQFAWNFAERGERAGVRIASLTHSRAVAGFKAALDNVITDCRLRLRALQTSLEQIGPTANALVAAKDNLRSIQERAESKSPEQLNTIFSAQSQVAGSRQNLLTAVVTYNQSIVEIERAKGTLLDYNNIVLTERPQ